MPRTRNHVRFPAAPEPAIFSEPVPADWGTGPFRWGTAVSAWGDSFVAAGNALHRMRAEGVASVGMLYYGWHGQVRDFLAAQPWCREALHVLPSSRRAFWRVVRYGDAADGPGWIPEVTRATGIDLQTLRRTHLSFDLEAGEPVRMWHGATLPAEAWEWARLTLAGLPEDVFFLHPWSFQSASLIHHWPHWPAAVRWLLRATPHTYVLTGHGYDPAPFGSHPRLVNRVGGTAHMHQVLALACLCRGVISTCNSPALWAGIQQLPALVMGNSGIANPTNLFARWIAQPNTCLLDWREPLPSFQGAARGFLAACLARPRRANPPAPPPFAVPCAAGRGTG